MLNVKRLLTSAEVAERLGITPRTLTEWRIRGYGPAFIEIAKRNIRYDSSDLENWLLSRKRGS